MLNLFLLFIIFIVIHAIYNLVNYLRYNHIEQLLLGNYSNDADLKIKARTHKNVILNYIKYSGVSDKHIPVSQPLGYGQVANGNVSILDNLLHQREDIAMNVMDLLLEAKGNYWSRFINSFNPFYWLRIILYIPKYLLSYLGVKADSIFIKIFQLLYWGLAVIFTFSISVFPEEIKTFLSSIIHFS